VKDEDKQLLEEENRKIKQLRVMVDLTKNTLYQDPSLNLTEAREMVFNLRKAATKLFPGKEGTFDLILLPRFERIVRERWGEGLDPVVN
jgi:hypothetical protein